MDMPSYNFGHFDDVHKESNDLTVDTTFGTTDNTTNSQSVLSNQELADISQVTNRLL